MNKLIHDFKAHGVLVLKFFHVLLSIFVETLQLEL